MTKDFIEYLRKDTPKINMTVLRGLHNGAIGFRRYEERTVTGYGIHSQRVLHSIDGNASILFNKLYFIGLYPRALCVELTEEDISSNKLLTIKTKEITGSYINLIETENNELRQPLIYYTREELDYFIISYRMRRVNCCDLII